MITIKNMSKYYGSLLAVDSLSLEIPTGELFCFLGPNGAGKTTTIKMLTGLLQPSSGSAEICGINIGKDPLAAKKRIGYIPDMPFLYDRLTTSEFLEFTGDLYNIDKKTVLEQRERLFDILGLNEQKSSLIKELSHGMRQRLIYASAFLHEPDVLFIDEPLIGLDPYTIRIIKDLLREKTSNGMTIFLTTHILALAQDVADRIGIIMNGKLVALGAQKELHAAHGGEDLESLFLHLTEAQYSAKTPQHAKTMNQEPRTTN